MLLGVNVQSQQYILDAGLQGRMHLVYATATKSNDLPSCSGTKHLVSDVLVMLTSGSGEGRADSYSKSSTLHNAYTQ